MPDSSEKLRPSNEVGESIGELKEVVKRDEKVEVPREVSSWLDQIERQQPNQNVVMNDPKQQPAAAPTIQYSGTKIPVTRTVFSSGFKKAVNSAGRWLSIFLFRLIKMKKGKVVFKDENV